MKITTRCFVVGLAVLVAGGLQAADKKGKAKGMAMDPAMQEAMKKSMPGERHKALEPFVGQFTTTNRMWMKPGEKAHESMGSSDHSWVFGGRFLKMDVRGDMDGQPFEGVGYIGYDNVRGEYTSVWLDNMNTGISRSSGQFDTPTQTLKESGTVSCPMTGEKDMPIRGEWKVIDSNTLMYTMYNPDPNGKEMKGMEITYKRK